MPSSSANATSRLMAASSLPCLVSRMITWRDCRSPELHQVASGTQLPPPLSVAAVRKRRILQCLCQRTRYRAAPRNCQMHCQNLFDLYQRILKWGALKRTASQRT